MTNKTEDFKAIARLEKYCQTLRALPGRDPENPHSIGDESSPNYAPLLTKDIEVAIRLARADINGMVDKALKVAELTELERPFVARVAHRGKIYELREVVDAEPQKETE